MSSFSSFRHRRGAFFAFSQSAPSESGVVDHRNVVLLHFLLNGTKKGASGPLRVFETWFRPYRCADLLIDDSVFGMDPFGINAADTRALLDAAEGASKYRDPRSRALVYRDARTTGAAVAVVPKSADADHRRSGCRRHLPGRVFRKLAGDLRTRGLRQLRADLGARPTWPQVLFGHERDLTYRP